MGYVTVCDPDKLVTRPGLPLTAGALDGTKTGKFYGEPYGQFVAALVAAGLSENINFDAPWKELGSKGKTDRRCADFLESA